MESRHVSMLLLLAITPLACSAVSSGKDDAADLGRRSLLQATTLPSPAKAAVTVPQPMVLETLATYTAVPDSAAMDPSNAGGLQQWWSLGPGLTFDGATVTHDASGTLFKSWPFPDGKTIPPGPIGGLDHVKHLSLTRDTFSAPTDGSVLVYRLSSIMQSTPGSVPPAYKPFVSNDQDDMRLGACAANFLDFTTNIVADIIQTSNGVWAVYERLPFGRGPALGNYFAFLFAKRIANKQPTDVVNAEVRYDRAGGRIKWLVNGKVGLVVDKIGFAPSDPKVVKLIDLGGVPTLATPLTLQAGIGCFTILDMADPNTGDPNSGLLRLFTSGTSNEYQVPATFAKDMLLDSRITDDQSLRVFGAGTQIRVTSFSVTRESIF